VMPATANTTPAGQLCPPLARAISTMKSGTSANRRTVSAFGICVWERGTAVAPMLSRIRATGPDPCRNRDNPSRGGRSTPRAARIRVGALARIPARAQGAKRRRRLLGLAWDDAGRGEAADARDGAPRLRADLRR